MSLQILEPSRLPGRYCRGHRWSGLSGRLASFWEIPKSGPVTAMDAVRLGSAVRTLRLQRRTVTSIVISSDAGRMRSTFSAR